MNPTSAGLRDSGAAATLPRTDMIEPIANLQASPNLNPNSNPDLVAAAVIDPR